MVYYVCVCVCSSTCLLPVLVEEEESVQDGTAEVVPTVSAGMEGREKNSMREEDEARYFLS